MPGCSERIPGFFGELGDVHGDGLPAVSPNLQGADFDRGARRAEGSGRPQAALGVRIAFRFFGLPLRGAASEQSRQQQTSHREFHDHLMMLARRVFDVQSQQY